MENYLGDFSQSETDKYFEWTINRYIINNIHMKAPLFLLALGLNFFFEQLDQNLILSMTKNTN